MTLDWRMRHGPVSGPAHAASALTLSAAVAALPAVALPPELILGGAAVTAGGMVLLTRGSVTLAALAYRVSALLGGAGWVAHVLTVGWSPASVATLAGGALAFGVLGRGAAARQRAADRRQEKLTAAYADQQVQDRLHGLADHWIHRIGTVCKVVVSVLAIEPWIHPGPDGRPRQTGYTLELRLPTNGATWRDIAAHTTGLAAAEDLPNGCGIEVQEGASRRRVLMHVSTVDALRDSIPLPASPEPRTINDPLDVGVRRDGSRAEISLQFDAAVLVGATGSGKSNEIQALMARVVECMDTLICVIDKNGGGLATPWLEPWATGDVDGPPPIYWVADTDEEAALMTEWLVELIAMRKRSQAAAMRAANDDKVAVSARVPQIVLIADEAGSLPPAVTSRITDISDRGRGSRIRTLVCGLRATNEYVPTPVLAQAATRIGMRVNDDRELGLLYNWTRTPDGADAPAPGYGFIGTHGQTPYVHKGYRVTPNQIGEIARATARYRPADVEAETLALLPPHLRRIGMDRWTRTSHIREAAATGAPAVPAEQPADTAPAAHPHPGGMAGALEELARKRDQLKDTMAQAEGDPFDQITAGLRSGVVPELIIRVLSVIGDADRMHTDAIAAALRVHKSSLGGLLSPVGIRPLRNGFDVGGRTGRGYARADVEAAAERIRAGDQEVPEAIANWRPAE